MPSYSLGTSIKNFLIPTKETRAFYKLLKMREETIEDELDVVKLITGMRIFNV